MSDTKEGCCCGCSCHSVVQLPNGGWTVVASLLSQHTLTKMVMHVHLCTSCTAAVHPSCPHSCVVGASWLLWPLQVTQLTVQSGLQGATG
jgi:hypothetical protein